MNRAFDLMDDGENNFYEVGILTAMKRSSKIRDDVSFVVIQNRWVSTQLSLSTTFWSVPKP